MARPLHGRWVLTVTGMALVALSLALPLRGESPRSVIVLPIKTMKGTVLEGEMIDPGIAAFFERIISNVNPNEVAAIVVDLNTFGGRVDSMVRICDALESCPVTTCAFVDNKAISAGAAIAISCEFLYMSPSASIGASTPVLAGAEGEMKTASPKVLSAIRAEFRARAEDRDRNPALAEAMVDPDVEVVEVDVDGKREIVNRDRVDKLERDAEHVEIVTIISKKGSVLTLSAREADEYGFISGLAEDLDDVTAKLGLADAPVIIEKANWAEELSRFITNPAIRSILLLVGLACIYAEIKIPGLGLPTLGAIICFGLLFFGHHVAGLAQVFEILLFLAGIGLILAEVFLIPGFGVTGVAGIALVLVSLVMVFTQRLIPDQNSPIGWGSLGTAIVNVGVGVAGSVVLMTIVVFLFGRFLPHIPLANRLMNRASWSRESPLKPEGEGLALVGKIGRAASLIRPSGRARIDDHVYDVLAEGNYIQDDAPIRVVRVDGRRIIVREIKEDA